MSKVSEVNVKSNKLKKSAFTLTNWFKHDAIQPLCIVSNSNLNLMNKNIEDIKRW